MGSVLASTGGILFGYDIGVISGALLQLNIYFNLTCFQQEVVTSSVLIGAFVMSLFGGLLVDSWGRKLAIIISSISYAIGAIITMLASSYYVLVVGRLILGMAISLSSTSECVYVSEISPINFRGTLIALNELGITLGFLLAYCANAIFANDDINGWRWMFGSSLVVIVLMALMLLFLPKSPRFLLMKGHVNDAKAILCMLRQTDMSSPAFIEEWSAMKSHVTETRPGIWKALRQASVRYSLMVAFSLTIIQQMTGQPTLLLYSSTVLVSFGFSESSMAAVCSVGIGMAKLLSTFICICVIEKFDRRYFLVGGSLVMSFTLFIISISAISQGIGAIESCSNSSSLTGILVGNESTVWLNYTSVDITEDFEGTYILRWVILFSFVLFVSAYAFSFGPVTWLFLSELFPTSIRGQAFSWSISINWLFQLLMSLSFLSLSNACGSIGWPYMMNAVFTLFSVGFLLKCLPETRGRSLEEIQSSVSKNSGLLKCCKCV